MVFEFSWYDSLNLNDVFDIKIHKKTVLKKNNSRYEFIKFSSHGKIVAYGN